MGFKMYIVVLNKLRLHEQQHYLSYMFLIYFMIYRWNHHYVIHLKNIYYN